MTEEQEKLRLIGEKKKKLRIRKQIIVNYRSQEEPYYVAIRVLSYNPDVTIKTLLHVALERKRKLEVIYGTMLKSMDKEVGEEIRQTDLSEDRGLNNRSIYVQVQIKKDIIMFDEIKVQ